MSTIERDVYDSHSPIEEKEWSSGRPPLGSDDPVEPNPHRDDPDEPDTDEPEEDDGDEAESE